MALSNLDKNRLEHNGFKDDMRVGKQMIKDNRIKIIVFAKSSTDREYLRYLFHDLSSHILYSDNEAVCFDNLDTIQPEIIILKTEDQNVVWRFVFALRTVASNAQIIVISDSLVESQFKAQNLGVSLDCINTAADAEVVLHHLRQQVMRRRPVDKTTITSELFVGNSTAISRINDLLPSLVRSSDAILITGEVGTGKETLARLIANHQNEESIFVKVDCSQFSKTPNIKKSMAQDNGGSLSLWELFDKCGSDNKPATLLLDKIHCLDRDAQSELLLYMDETLNQTVSGQTGKLHCTRFIATSELNISDQVKSGKFRKALYYRLNVIPLFLPPLRHRKEDISVLTDLFLIISNAKCNRSFKSLSSKAADRLWSYQWPGNVDELQRILERVVESGEEGNIFAHTGNGDVAKNTFHRLPQRVGSDMLPKSNEIQNCLPDIGKSSLKTICDQFACRTEKNLLRIALETTKWNRKKAAGLLNISYKSMLNKMKMYEIV